VEFLLNKNISLQLAVEYGFDTLDLHYYLRHQLQRRAGKFRSSLLSEASITKEGR
jgi:hypothetical protein